MGGTIYETFKIVLMSNFFLKEKIVGQKLYSIIKKIYLISDEKKSNFEFLIIEFLKLFLKINGMNLFFKKFEISYWINIYILK